MKSFFIACLLLVGIYTGVVFSASQSYASGDVVLQQDGDLLQLGNQVTETSTSSTNATIKINPMFSLIGTELSIPEGFATTLAAWLNAVLSMVMVVASLLVLTYIIWGAFDWLTSGGDKGKTESARNKITAAIVGLIIVSASYAILLLVIQFLGFADINDVFENVQTLDGTKTTSRPKPSISPQPSATPTYSDTLEELL